MTSVVSFSPAAPADEPAIAQLLRAAGLPADDFGSHLQHFLVAREAAGRIIGAIGAEVFSGDALLRSFVIAPDYRGQGLGRELFKQFEALAGKWGVSEWWLL